MATVDFRTRFHGSAVDVDAGAFRDDTLPSLVDEHGTLAARGYAQLGLSPLALDFTRLTSRSLRAIVLPPSHLATCWSMKLYWTVPHMPASEYDVP